MMTEILGILIAALLSQNFILVKFYGICPFMGVSKKLDTALGMGAAVTFVMSLASAATWLVNHFILVPMDLEYMQTVAFILVIASIVQVVEMFLKKKIPALYEALGIYLPLITTNCAVLGVAIIAVQKDFDLLTSVVYSVSIAVGFAIALVLFAGIRERLEVEDVPQGMRGVPIALITAGLLAMAFMGFANVVPLP